LIHKNSIRLDNEDYFDHNDDYVINNNNNNNIIIILLLIKITMFPLLKIMNIPLSGLQHFRSNMNYDNNNNNNNNNNNKNNRLLSYQLS